MKHVSIAFIIAALLELVSTTASATEATTSAKAPSPEGASSSAEAAPASPDGETRTATPTQSELHRPGFYASVRLGLGYGSFGSDFYGTDMGVSGPGVEGSILCGGMVADNFAVVGDLEVLSLPNPTVKVGDVSVGAKDAKASLVGIGPGVVYYFTPANVSLGASLLLTRLSISQGDETIGQTDLGFGGKLLLGKEWALRNGGIGIVGDFSLSSMKDKDDGPRWTGTTVGVSAAYTYN